MLVVLNNACSTRDCGMGEKDLVAIWSLHMGYLDWIDSNYLVFNSKMRDRTGLTAIIWSSIVTCGIELVWKEGSGMVCWTMVIDWRGNMSGCLFGTSLNRKAGSSIGLTKCGAPTMLNAMPNKRWMKD
jgi:hypothetical protein